MTHSEVFVRSSRAPGLDEALVRALVAKFYEALREDETLGPVFVAAVGEDWSEHIERITAFWLQAAGIRRGYEGRNFMPAHLRHPAIRADQLPVWLGLFRKICRRQCPPEAGDFLIGVAERMAENLKISLERRDN